MKQPQTLIRKPFEPAPSESPRMDDPSLTEPHYESSCDIGKIIAGHMRTTGQLPPPPAGDHFIDLTKIPLARELALEAKKRGLTAQEYAANILQEASESVRSAESQSDETAALTDEPASQAQDPQNP